MLVDRFDLGSLGKEGAHHRPAAFVVEAEIVEGIGVAAFDDRIGLGGELGHEASCDSCDIR